MEEIGETSIDAEEDRKNYLSDESEASNISKDQIINTIQTKPVLSSLKSKNLTTNIKMENVLSFKDLIDLSLKKKEIKLKYDLEKNVNLIKFAEGKIDISFNENLNKNFVRNLSEKLLEWTGKRWVITLTKEIGQKTFLESRDIKEKEFIQKEKAGEVYKKFKNIFPDGELLGVKKKE